MQELKKQKLAWQPKTLTTSFKVGVDNLISDEELFYYFSSCPFFQTFRDKEVSEVKKILLPLFRYYHYRRMSSVAMSFADWTRKFNEYMSQTEKTGADFNKFYKKLERYFINFYSLFNPTKKYKILFPYYPYKYDTIMGCSELVIETKSGIRIYDYCFDDAGVGPEELNYYGFKLQLAARIFHIKTGVAPGSMAVAYPACKTPVYFTYDKNEQIERYLENNLVTMVRRYGSHCQYCFRKGCIPLIDRQDKYGWRVSELEEHA